MKDHDERDSIVQQAVADILKETEAVTDKLISKELILNEANLDLLGRIVVKLQYSLGLQQKS